jgi:hypothetical protein
MKLRNNGKSSGIRNSLHGLKLAIDLNLFNVDGTYLTDKTSWLPIGVWWEQQNVLCAWGGRFGDLNHFSITYQGRK